MVLMYNLRCNGRWLSTVAPWGDLSVTWRWGDSSAFGGGGLAEVTWQMQVAPDFDHPSLRIGAVVEVMDGAVPVGAAIMAEPGRTDTGTAFTATGLYRQAESTLCLSSTGDSTSTLDTAIDVGAAMYGLQWLRQESLSSTPTRTGDTTNGLNFLSDLIPLVADEQGKRFWVDGYRVPHLTVDQTTPRWHLRPGVVDLSVAADDFANILIGRYISGTTYVSTTAIDTKSAGRFGAKMLPVDMTNLGPISATRAQARLQGVLRRGKARPTLTDRIEVSPYELLTVDGQPAPLSMVRGGDMIRAHGLDGDAATLNGHNYLDFIIGEVVDDQQGTITIGAVDLAARSLSDAFAQVPTTRKFAA